VAELLAVIKWCRENPDEKEAKDAFKPDDWALSDFLLPTAKASAGPGVVSRYRELHHPAATDFEGEIIEGLDHGQTVILDQAPDSVAAAYSSSTRRCSYSPSSATSGNGETRSRCGTSS
jgi:hypothetical protein